MILILSFSLLFFQFRGPEILKGAFARGILQNNAGNGYLKLLTEQNGFKPTLFLTQYIVFQDKKRIEDEEAYMKREMDRKIEVVKVATGAASESSYKSGQFD